MELIIVDFEPEGIIVAINKKSVEAIYWDMKFRILTIHRGPNFEQLQGHPPENFQLNDLLEFMQIDESFERNIYRIQLDSNINKEIKIRDCSNVTRTF